MTFLQHFLPGQPLEENGHVSSGVMFSASTDKQNRSTVFGLDLGWADVYLRETQFGPTSGSAFLQETRPSGKHYDYDVTSIVMAPFVQVEWALSDKLLMSAGLRGEYISYKYRNNMSVGNARDDGTLCGFGGCLYTRPADRRDEFTNVVPKVGFVFSVSDDLSVYGNFAQGFRAPQMTELYRLQSGQLISDLKSESMDSLEFGMRFGGEYWQLDSSLFAMRKKNSVFRDSEGFNVSGARSKHRGIEVALELSTQERWLFRINGTYARHQYDFDAVAQRGEAFVSGRDIDTAPRWHGDVELRFLASESADVSLSWVAIGDYYLDAENRFEYPGHTLLNLRGRVEIRGDFSIAAHIKNLGDERLADRADYAFGNYRYFPGRGREYFVHLRYGY
jgi:outer membrane receptor protein involved in Fe transport